MSQAPATPKSARARRLLTAALRGPEAALRTGAPGPAEAAALRLRAARPARAPEPAEVVFLVPLVGRHHVGDWEAVSARLARTLASFAAQTDGRWQALVCGQDRPDIALDGRVTFLPFSDEIAGNDKWDKLARLCAALPEAAPQGYAMPFDADDLLHPGAVAEMRARRAAGGYLVETGYVRDVARGRIALAGPRRPGAPLRKPFWKLCGSCAAFAFAGAPEDTAFLAAATRHEHRMFPYLARLAGRPLSALSRPSVLYELNHGENFGARRGRVSFKTGFVERYRIDDPDRLAGIGEAFGLSPGGP
ncbi:hypothetical protein OG2516_07330 [Oceanicola granulosus HTCC2516]|uniref:Uncharacterized protein n=1 Tax=Oceanicola granulosus (strain ATCC BAA-861 / DSM 15982 / KCTC 12143 / HTCC2516) TaxID=314256 RepID=Q2CBG8_OCEGH|nr:hypothetical protein [Oceanicola granulosus]EAR49995.1 hypothetical protein OG2516_07330 [Oceanicola granulosus HTCC2516]